MPIIVKFFSSNIGIIFKLQRKFFQREEDYIMEDRKTNDILIHVDCFNLNVLLAVNINIYLLAYDWILTLILIRTSKEQIKLCAANILIYVCNINHSDD